ncbi:MAG TPA: PIN domain-containing protein [Solirubrobacteraceae bacterium]|nr:PIN domain-containing protein [Solirubrobacteraceae bacterium]
MILAADASVLVGELLRKRGRELLLHPDLRVLVAEQQWEEAEHELSRRLSILESQERLTLEQRLALERAVSDLIETRAIEVVPRDTYASLEQAATERVPRDRRDWPTVALAMALDAGILTGDNDFLGCGCPTWTVETLKLELERQASSQ